MFKKSYTSWSTAQHVSDLLNIYNVSFNMKVDDCGKCTLYIDEITPSNIYLIAKALLPSEHIDHYNSDLYIKVTPDSNEIIKQLKPKSLLTTFTDNIEHTLWYDLPFCYGFNKEV